ncbi:MAG: ATP-binding cassette domain-containing protein [Dehalococcoidia bacterium]|nr:ATP-binding cassette domain-containing protein [Dehalococcoidia bacterium]
MIEVQNLTKYYGDFIAIENVSFEAKRGEVVGFLGPNAAGKTTTMRIITGFMPPSAGTVRVAGYDIQTHSIEARRQVGYLPETTPLYTDISVRDYLDFMGGLRGMAPARRRTRIDYVIQRMRLEEYAHTLIGRLSKGYRQRVGIAQAVLHEPEVLILDEPTIGIDPVQVVETRELIKSLGKEHTVVLSTHILPEVSQICERVVVINEGHIVAVDRPENLSVRLRGTEQVKVEVRGPARDVSARIRRIQGVREVTQRDGASGASVYTLECDPGSNIREELASAIVQQGWGLLGLQAVTMSLEDIFLKLTTHEDEAKPQ